MNRHENGAASTAIDATPSELRSSSYSIAVSDFYRLLNFRRQVAAGVLPEPNGFYYGDGVARDFSGHPFEPLEWTYLKKGRNA